MCDIFNVSRSGYYAWLNRSPSNRDLSNKNLDEKIVNIFIDNKSRYGAPRITKKLQKQGEICSYNRVARRMSKMNLKAVAKKKFKVTTDSEHDKPIYENILSQNFKTTAINQKWAGDISYIKTVEGWMYLAVVIDLFSRAVIGWSMSSRMKKDLVCNALTMALFRRKFPTKVIMHTDRGSQYCSDKYRNLIKSHGLIGSMSRKGNCWDNAISESFFHTLKVELTHREKYKTRDIAKKSIFDYIEIYYNRQRMHSAINYMTPIEVELAA